MPAFGGKADMPFCTANVRLWTQSGHHLALDNARSLRASEAALFSAWLDGKRSEPSVN